MFSCKQGQTSVSNITKNMFWWNRFCNNYKDYYTNKSSKELFYNSFGQDGNGPNKVPKRARSGNAHPKDPPILKLVFGEQMRYGEKKKKLRQ